MQNYDSATKFEERLASMIWQSDFMDNPMGVRISVKKNLTDMRPDELVKPEHVFTEDSDLKSLSSSREVPRSRPMAVDIASPVTDSAALSMNQLYEELVGRNRPTEGEKGVCSSPMSHRQVASPAARKLAVKEQAPAFLPARPAQFCHICWRSTKRVEIAVCSNISSSVCRKVICRKCFDKFGWDWEAALGIDSTWLCTHCNGNCPAKAQCYVYGRTNERRRKQRMALKTNTM